MDFRAEEDTIETETDDERQVSAYEPNCGC